MRHVRRDVHLAAVSEPSRVASLRHQEAQVSDLQQRLHRQKRLSGKEWFAQKSPVKLSKITTI
jgi:hypothetical protein